MTSRSKRVSTLTYEPGLEEPVFGLRPGCEQFPIPRDAEDFALLSSDRLLLARADPLVHSEPRLELRSLDHWEPAPYAMLSLRPPIAVERGGRRALVQVELIEGFESSLAVVDLDRFEVIAQMPFTAPFEFVPDDAPCLKLAPAAPELPPPEQPAGYLGSGTGSVPPPPGSIQARRSSIPPPPRRSQLPPVRASAPPPRGAPARGIVATMPHEIADDALIARQPYAQRIHARLYAIPGGGLVSSRSTAIVDYERNVLHRVNSETLAVRHAVVPDENTLLTVTAENVFVRRTDLATGAIAWDVPIGQNRPGSVFSAYAVAFADTMIGRLLAVAVFDQRVDLIDVDSGETVAKLRLHPESRARIDALAWHPRGAILAKGMANGTVMLTWVPSRRNDPWRVRLFRGAIGGVRALRFHGDGRRLFVLSGDGQLRAWDLLEDEQAVTVGGKPAR